MSMSTLGSGVGTFAMAPIITALLNEYMFCGAMLVMAGMQFNNLIAGALYRPLKQHPKQQELKQMNHEKKEPLLDKKDNAENKEQDSKQKSFWKSQTEILTNVTFLIYGFQIFAMSICIQTFLTYLPSLSEQYGSSKTMAALLLSVVGLSDMAGRFIFGFLFDLRTVRYRRRLFHACLGIPVGLLCLLMGYLSSYTMFMVVGVLYGVVEGGFHSQRATIVSEFVSKDKMSSTVGFVIFFQGFGNLAGPPVAGKY